MNCDQYREWMSAEIDGMLDEKQARLLQQHLADCPACRQAKADLEKTVALIRALPEMAAPQNLPDAVRQRIAAKPKIHWPVLRILTMPLTRVTLAAALLMIVVIYGYRPMTSVTRDAESAKAEKEQVVVDKAKEYAQAKVVENAPAPAAEKVSGPEPAKRSESSSVATAPSASLKAKAAPRAVETDKAPAPDNFKDMKSNTGEGGPERAAPRDVPPMEKKAVRSKDADRMLAADSTHGGGPARNDYAIGVAGGAPWLQEKTVAAARSKDADSVSAADGLKSASEPGMAGTENQPMKLAAQGQAEAREAKIQPAEYKQRQQSLEKDLEPKRDIAKRAEEKSVMASPASEIAIQSKAKDGGQAGQSAAAPAALSVASASPPAAPRGSIAKEMQVARAEKSVASGRRAEASAAERKPGAGLVVVTANPAAVMRLLEPYRSQPPGKAMGGQQDGLAESGAARRTDEKKSGEQDRVIADRLQAAEQEGQAGETLTTVWVPAREYAGLLEKIRELGEITENGRQAGKARGTAAGVLADADQSAESIAIQVRIIRAGRE